MNIFEIVTYVFCMIFWVSLMEALTDQFYNKRYRKLISYGKLMLYVTSVVTYYVLYGFGLAAIHAAAIFTMVVLFRVWVIDVINWSKLHK